MNHSHNGCGEKLSLLKNPVCARARCRLPSCFLPTRLRSAIVFAKGWLHMIGEIGILNVSALDKCLLIEVEENKGSVSGELL